jgi:hypothetical protein
MTVTPDFQTYLRSLSSTYKDWWNLYTLFDFGLMAETVQPRQADGVPSQEKIERLPVIDGVQKYVADHVLLVGRPGSGKSTALVRLLLEEVQRAQQSQPLSHSLTTEPSSTSFNASFNTGSSASSNSGQGDRIPVLIELRYYQTSILDSIHESFRRHGLSLSPSDIAELLQAGRLLLLLDGLNELPSDAARQDLATFRKANSNTPMVFSTRDLGRGGDLGIEKTLEMQPLTEAQMRDFVQAYLPDGEPMLRRLKNRLREFGQTPLLLWMLCSLFQQVGDLPPTLGLVLRQFTQGYEQQLQTAVDRHKLQAPELSDRWSDLLRALAFAMMQGAAPTDFHSAIAKPEAALILAKALTDQSPNCQNAEALAHRCLDDLLQYHLLQTVRGNHIEFRHQLLQEYFAAEQLLRLIDQGQITDPANGDLSGDLALKRDYFNYLKWTEPLALMVALIEEGDRALYFVQLALQVDLKLGARLAGEVQPAFQERAIQLITQLELPELIKLDLLATTRSEYVIPHLLNALDHLDATLRRRAAAALGQLGSEAAVLGLLRAIKDREPEVRQRAVYALGQVGSETAISGLLRALKDSTIKVRLGVVHALGQLTNEDAVLGLVKALKDRNADVRRSAAAALGKLGSESAIPRLLRALDHDTEEVRHSAAAVLRQIGSEIAIPGLLKALAEQRAEGIGEALEK